MPHVERPHRGRHLFSGPLPLGGRAVAVLVAFLTLVILLLLLVQDAKGNFVYWTNDTGTSIGRAKINGAGANNQFIAGLNDPLGIAVDSKFIYWSQGTGASSSIGRANLDGSGANPNFIPNSAGVSNPRGVAVTASGIYWGQSGAIGRANLDGSNPASDFITIAGLAACGVAADQNYVYWLDTGLSLRIGRATLAGGGVEPNFVPVSSANCGVAVDTSFLYWTPQTQSIGRAPVAGGSADENFIPNATPAAAFPCGVAVNPQYAFWGNPNPVPAFVGRADIGGGNANGSFIPGTSSPCLLAAAPSNKVTINSVKKKKKKGTATINAKVPGPGQVTLSQTSAPPDPNATEAAVKQVGLTITQASSFNLAVKPVGKTAKKLNKQIKKQLKKKRKAKAKANVTVFIHFVPAGVAGVPNTERLKVTLVKQRKKKKR